MSPCSSLQGGRALCPVCSLELQGPGECECEELAHTLFSRVSALLRASPGNPVPLWDGGGDVWTLTLQDSPLFCVEVPPPPRPPTSPASIATGIWICYYSLFLLETQHELAMALRLVGGL